MRQSQKHVTGHRVPRDAAVRGLPYPGPQGPSSPAAAGWAACLPATGRLNGVTREAIGIALVTTWDPDRRVALELSVAHATPGLAEGDRTCDGPLRANNTRCLVVGHRTCSAQTRDETRSLSEALSRHEPRSRRFGVRGTCCGLRNGRQHASRSAGGYARRKRRLVVDARRLARVGLSDRRVGRCGLSARCSHIAGRFAVSCGLARRNCVLAGGGTMPL